MKTLRLESIGIPENALSQAKIFRTPDINENPTCLVLI